MPFRAAGGTFYSSMDLDDVMELVLLQELMAEDGGLLAQAKRGATMDNLQDLVDGTGRWDRKGVPHERRWWNQKAHKVPSATFRSWFRCRCDLRLSYCLKHTQGRIHHRKHHTATAVGELAIDLISFW